MNQMLLSGLSADTAVLVANMLQARFPHTIRKSSKHGDVKVNLTFTSGNDWVAVEGKVPMNEIPILKAYAQGVADTL